MYADGRFARHPRFRYFALNTELRWRALQAGRIYVRQHPHDAQLFFVLTWLLFYHCSSALRRNVYIGMFAQAHPPMPCIRLVEGMVYSTSELITEFSLWPFCNYWGRECNRKSCDIHCILASFTYPAMFAYYHLGLFSHRQLNVNVL